MDDARNFRERFDSEESREKAKALFSKKFIEYLSSKELPGGGAPEGTPGANPSLPAGERTLSQSSDDTSASESSRKSIKKVRKKLKEKRSYKNLDFHYGFRNKLTQCSQLKTAEEVAPPEELKALLVNMTILLQDLKQFPLAYAGLIGLVSRITILVTEFVRRPLKKVEEKKEHSKNADKTAEAMSALLDEYKHGSALDSDNGIREYKRIEREIASKVEEIEETKKKLSGETSKESFKEKDVNARVRDSILGNEKLKADIKFNQNHIKKYKKILLEKEWTKHKVESELTHLKKKMSRADLPDGENPDANSKSPESSSRSESLVKTQNKTNSKREKEKSKPDSKGKKSIQT